MFFWKQNKRGPRRSFFSEKYVLQKLTGGGAIDFDVRGIWPIIWRKKYLSEKSIKKR